MNSECRANQSQVLAEPAPQKGNKNGSKRKVNKEMVGELGKEKSESRKELIICVKYNLPGIRGINDVKWYVWNETQRADRKWFSEGEILKFKLSKDKQL